MTGLWKYAEQFMTAHEVWCIKHDRLMPGIYLYDPADDGPEVDIIRCVRAAMLDRTPGWLSSWITSHQ